MKNIKFPLLIATILLVSACEVPRDHSFQGSGGGAWPSPAFAQPTQHTACELVPQFSFEKDEAMEIVIKCEEDISY